MSVAGHRRGIGVATSVVASCALAITAAPALADAPNVTAPPDFAINEDQTSVLSAANGFTVSDADPGDLTIDVDASNGVINLATTSGLTNLAGDGTNEVSFEGDATEVSAALDGMSFVPTSNFNGGANVVVNADDGTTAVNDAVAITVNAVNDNPVNAFPATQVTNEDTPKVLSTGNGNSISVSDVDAGGASIQVSLDARVDGAADGTITLGGTSGLTFTTGDGNADPNVAFTGTIADINTALDGLAFTPKQDVFGTGEGQIRIFASDLGNSPGPTRTDTDTLLFDITAVDNDPPTPSLPAGLGTYKNLNKTLSLADLTQLKVEDPDFPPSNTEVEVELTSTHGTMTLSSTTNLTFNSGANGSSTMTFEGDQSDINGALDNGLTFGVEAGFTGQATISATATDVIGTETASDTFEIEIDQPEESVYWTGAKETTPFRSAALGRAELDGGGGADLVTGPELNDTPSGVAIDAVQGKIYWASTGAIDPGDRGIWRANLDGTGKELFLTSSQAFDAGSHLDSANNMAIDQESRRLYWANADNATPADRGISYISLDNITSGGRVSTGSANVSSPRGLALDLENDRVYWSNATMTQGIFYAPLPPTTATAANSGSFVISGSGVVGPSGVAVDLEANPDRLFWANNNQGVVGDEATRLRYADLPALETDGTTAITGQIHNISPNAGGGMRTPAIDTEANRIYWANSSTDRISHANLDGTGGGTDLASGAAMTNSADGVVILKKPEPVGTPAIAGTAEVGQTLTCDAEWAADAPNAALYRMPATTSFEWTRNGATISGANGATHTPDSTGDYRCKSTASNFAGSANQQSAARSVAAAPDPPPDDTPPDDAPPETPPEDPPEDPPDNDIDFGDAKVEKKNGTAKLSVQVPGAGALHLEGKGVKTVETDVDGAGTETLKITATGKTKKKLKKKGKAKVTVEVTFTPDGGEPNTETKQVTLKEK